MNRKIDPWPRGIAVIVAGNVVSSLLAVGASAGESSQRASHGAHVEQSVQVSETADFGLARRWIGNSIQTLMDQVGDAGRWVLAWYRRTPPADRVIWGGLTACAGLGFYVLCERLARLRRQKTVPSGFTERFVDRLLAAKLDCGQALDHCELNPSAAARVALAAVRRWGRPAADLERAVALAQRVETERLNRNVKTLRRIAALAPLLGLLGTLFSLGSALETTIGVPGAGAMAADSAGSGSETVAAPPAVGRALAAALTPLSVSVVLATLALVAYDALRIRIESLSGELDRVGAETIDAIALVALRSTPPRLAPVRSTTMVHSGAPATSILHRTPGRPGERSGPTPTHEVQESGF
jgi:biopolymer transport protein ExbB